ncbi:MAG: hypothetical protein AAF628_26965 [Planctomycetota bacterium]
MRPEDLHADLRRRPFVPFQLRLTDGATYAVHHRELMMIGTRTVEIGISSERYAEPTFQRVVSVSLLHIVEIETLPQADAG